MAGVHSKPNLSDFVPWLKRAGSGEFFDELERVPGVNLHVGLALDDAADDALFVDDVGDAGGDVDGVAEDAVGAGGVYFGQSNRSGKFALISRPNAPCEAEVSTLTPRTWAPAASKSLLTSRKQDISIVQPGVKASG